MRLRRFAVSRALRPTTNRRPPILLRDNGISGDRIADLTLAPNSRPELSQNDLNPEGDLKRFIDH